MNSIFKAASAYIEAGFGLCATRASNHKEAYGAGWQNSSRAAAHWDKNKDDGIGIIHARSGTCSVDLDALNDCRIALEAVGVNLDKLLASGVHIDSGRPDRGKLLYKAPAGLPQKRHALNWPTKDGTDKYCVIEFRAGNVHDVLPPSIHPDTGQEYKWVGNWEDLPELPDELQKIWHEWNLAKEAMTDACPWAVRQERSIPKTATLAARPTEHGDVIGTFNRSYDIGSILVNNNYKQAGRRWLAPNSSTGIPGVCQLPDSDPVMVYSFHGSDILCDDHAHDAFSAYCILEHGGNISAAVAQAAKDLGIEPPKDKEAERLALQIMSGSKKNNVTPISEEIPKKVKVLQQESKAPERQEAPVEMLNKVYKWLESQMHSVKPDAIMQTTLAFACAVTARRYITSSGQPTAAFFGISDSSTAGIRPLRDKIYQLCNMVGERKLIRGTGFGGASQVYQTLIRCPRVFWATDEYGYMIRRNKKQTSGAIESALAVIHEIYNGGTLFIDPDTATQKARDLNDCDIYAPSLNVLALLGDDHVSAMTAQSEYMRGTLQQMILIPAGDEESSNYDITNDNLPGGLVEHINRIAKTPGIAGQADAPTIKPHQTVVGWEPETSSVFRARHSKWINFMSTDERHRFKGMAHGYLQSAIRLASTLAAWECPESPKIKPAMAAWALDWCERCLMLSMPRIEISSGNEEGKDLQEAVMTVLLDSKVALTNREIGHRCRPFRALSNPDREALMNILAEDGLIIPEQTARTTKYLASKSVR